MDPFEDMTKPKYPKVKRGSLEEDELLTIFSKDGVFKSPLEKVVCALAFLSGLRRGEVFAVEPGDLDRVGKRIDVEHNWRAFGRKDKELGLPKWDKIRTAPLSKITIKAIDALEAAQGIHERVCVFPNGKTPSERWWTNHVGACLRRAGIDTAGRKITPHSSRHSIASVLYARGTPLKPIQEMLGHSDLSTTDLYIHTPAGAIDEITGAIDRATGPAARRGRVKGKAKNTDRSWE
jgi:integrase/recombinase XerD